MFSFLGCIYLGVEVLDNMITLLNILMNYQTVFRMVHHCMFPTVMYEGSNLSTSLPLSVFLVIIILMCVKSYFMNGFHLS